MTGSVTVGPNRTASRRAPSHAGLAFTSVVHVNEKGGSFGGTEEYIALLTSELARLGVRSHLVCGLVTGHLPPDLSSVHIVDGLASRQPLPATAAELLSLIERLDPDVIYLHNVFDPAAVTAVAALANRGVLIWYVHDHYLTCLSELRWRRDVGSCPQRLGGACLVAIGEGLCVLRHPDRSLGDDDLAERTRLSRSLGDADGIVVVSEYMRSLLEEAEPDFAERIHLVDRPIRHDGASRLRYRDKPGDPAVITFAGRITPEKGLAVVIEALGAARGHGPIELRIAGIVEHEAYWSHCQHVQVAAMAANPDLTVTYLGHLDYEATDDLLRDSDIVTIPSRWPEPLGTVAIEAMSAGAAVVASNIGGLATHLVDDRNGLLVDPGNVTAWTAAIESLLHNPGSARRLGERARQRAAGLTATHHVRALDRIVKSASAERRTPTGSTAARIDGARRRRSTSKPRHPHRAHGGKLSGMPGSDAKADLHRYLQTARDALLWKMDGLSEHEIRLPMVPTGTNLLGLVKHVASVEAGYLGDTFARPFDEPLPWLDDDAEPNADMWATADESSDQILGLYHRVWAHSDATIDTLALDAMGHVPWWPDERSAVTLHVILVHMIAETNRHAGHADIVRELVDGAVGLRDGNDNMAPGDAAWWESYHSRLQQVAQQAGND